MKNFLFLLTVFGLMLVIGACAQDEQTLEANELQTRIIFKHEKDFIDTFNKLSALSYEEQVKWVYKQKIASSLLDKTNCDDTEMLKMPTAFQALFNEQLEIQINDSILKYHNGKFYYITQSKEDIICGDACVIPLDEQPSTRMTNTTVMFGKLGLNHQHGFIPVNYKDYYTFKYVHELKSVHISLNNSRAEALFLTLKLEYDRKGWNEAGENRTAILNFTGNVSLGVNQSTDISRSNQTFNIRNNYDILLCPAFIIPIGVFYNNWSVKLNGTITHWMTGYPETKWVDTW